MTNLRSSPIFAAAILLFAGATAKAEVGYALTTSSVLAPSGGIVQFDTANPGAASSAAVAITGTTGSEVIIDIDVYPVNGGLFGIGLASGTLYRINPVTGVATVDVVPQTPFANTPFTIDFNPTADRLRVISTDLAGTNDRNSRLTPSTNTAGSTGANAGLVTDDGTLVFKAGDANFGANPRIVAAAYTNNFDGTPSTALYSLDSALNILVLHESAASPAPAGNFSVLTTAASFTLGGTAFDFGDNAGFDISITGSAFLSNGNSLYSLASVGTVTPTIAVTNLGTIGTAPTYTVKSIALVPEPGSVGFLAIGGVLAMLRRKR